MDETAAAPIGVDPDPSSAPEAERAIADTEVTALALVSRHEDVDTPRAGTWLWSTAVRPPGRRRHLASRWRLTARIAAAALSCHAERYGCPVRRG